MLIETFEEYQIYYETYGKLPLPQVNYSTKPLNERQLQTKFKDYQKKVQAYRSKTESLKAEGIESQFVSDYAKSVAEAMEKSKESDPNHERWNAFFNKLSASERNVLNGNMWMCPKKDGKYVFDTAHIIERGTSPKLADEIKNMIEIPRAFHHYIDSYRNPLTEEHEMITRTEHDRLWIELIGQELWEWLNEHK